MSPVTGVLLILCFCSRAIYSNDSKKTSSAEVKAGTCPVAPENCKKAPRLNGICTKDYQCSGDLKCCVQNCEYACVEPVRPEKSGQCPRVVPPHTVIHFACTSVNTTACMNDMDCKGHQKCCREFCSNKCRDPVEKAGICPVPPEKCFKGPRLDGICTKDYQCPEDLKCCVRKCEYACVKPARLQKSGQCPYIFGSLHAVIRFMCPVVNKTICENDVDCEGRQKCCSEYCVNKCRDPVDKPTPVKKSGECPHEGPFQVNQTACVNDLDCKDHQKCCNKICANQCGDPVGVPPLGSPEA